jgi:hypothetical protein
MPCSKLVGALLGRGALLRLLLLLLLRLLLLLLLGYNKVCGATTAPGWRLRCRDA